MNLEEIKANYDKALERQAELLEFTKTRDLTDDEEKEFDTLTESVRTLSKDMEKANKYDEQRRLIAQNKFKTEKKTEEAKVTEKFSLFRAINQLAKGKDADDLDGAEGEMHQEAKREAREAGRTLEGFGLPAFQLRAQDASTAATAANLISTDLSNQFIPALRPNIVLTGLGATAFNGLKGNVDVPGGNALATATWEGETDQAANTDPSTRLVELRPNRLAAITTLSKRLITQASLDAEAWVRNELSNAIARAVDYAGINGNGGNIEGIMATTGVNEISFAGAVNRADLVNLMTIIDVNNYRSNNMAFLTSPVVKGELLNLEVDSGSGMFVMNPNNDMLLGYKVVTTTHVPTNINSTKTAVIFGDFSQLAIANWGGVDIIVDPYVRAEYGQVRLIINSEWDVRVLQPKAFAFGNDITWTALS